MVSEHIIIINKDYDAHLLHHNEFYQKTHEGLFLKQSIFQLFGCMYTFINHLSLIMKNINSSK